MNRVRHDRRNLDRDWGRRVPKPTSKPGSAPEIFCKRAENVKPHSETVETQHDG